MVNQGENLNTDYCVRNLGGELLRQFNMISKYEEMIKLSINSDGGTFSDSVLLIHECVKAFCIKENSIFPHQSPLSHLEWQKCANV